MKVPTEADFDNGLIQIDYALVNEAIVVTDEYFSLVIDGTVHMKNESELSMNQKEKLYNTMPAHNPDAAELQLMLSEYSLNTMLLTAVELNLLNYTNSDQGSAGIELLMNNFEGTYGVQENVTIIVNSAQEDFKKYRPSVQISTGGSLITFYLDIHIRNPLDLTQDAATLLVEATSNVTFFVDNTFKLQGHVRTLDLNVVDF